MEPRQRQLIESFAGGRKLFKVSPYLSILLLVSAAIISVPASEQQIQQESSATAANNNRHQQHITLQGSSSSQYNAPFLVLMSSEEISVAQLPLIDNGNVSVAYRLDADASGSVSLFALEDGEHEQDDGRNAKGGSSSSSSSSSRSPRSVAIADAREYEQMPQSTSLGKSEWQQIAGRSNSGVSAAGAAAAAVGRDRGQEEVGERRWGEDASAAPAVAGAERSVRGGRQIRRTPRTRRSSSSNSFIGDDGNNNGRANAVLESAAVSNVTSARFRKTAAEEAAERAAAPLTEDDDKNGGGHGGPGRVQFSDFDVHMALGYAFVADSNGRIHRFRLSGFERGGTFNENDHTNTIAATVDTAASSGSVAGASTHFSLSSSGSSSRPGENGEVSLSNSGQRQSVVIAAGDNSASGYSDYDANKVGQGSSSSNGSDVPHEQSGRHPAVSGTGGHFQKGSAAPTSDGAPSSAWPLDAAAAGVNHVSILRRRMRDNDDDDSSAGLAPGSAAKGSSKFGAWSSFAADSSKSAVAVCLPSSSSSLSRAANATAEISHNFRATDNYNFYDELESTNDDLLIVSNDFEYAFRLQHQQQQQQQQAAAIGTGDSEQLKKQHSFSNGAKPRIIWSRIKYGLPTVAPAVGGAHQQRTDDQRAAVSHRGALPGQDVGSNQLANATTDEHMGSGNDNDAATAAAADDDDDQQQLTNGNGGDAEEQRQRRPHGALGESENEQTSATGRNQPMNKLDGGDSSLRTEIAVDWLNNLLFVLDKYRLVVIDFDGNNELVIIDDFNANNRPVDIKVDPVNDFLFWLQVGKFHNTIYKLDLNVLSMPTAMERWSANALKLSQSSANSITAVPGGGSATTDLVALISHHYAHPIITNLPRHTKLFTIDHKHSRIYVPLASASPAAAAGEQRNKTQRDDTEVFAPPADESNDITHMNYTANQIGDQTNSASYEELSGEGNCNYTGGQQILAYNLDGTDVGPLRGASEKSHLSGMDDIQDITLDSANGFLYWLTNGGKELFEEYRGGDRDSALYSAQHSLDGKQYSKLLHVDDGQSNQPRHLKPRFNLRKLIHMLSPASSSASRWIRSDGQEVLMMDQERGVASGLNGGRSANRVGADSDVTRLSRNAPYIILGVTCLVVLSVYLIYALIFQHSTSWRHSNTDGDGSISGRSSSSIGESQVDCGASSAANGFIGTSTISRWIVRPSTTRSTDTTSAFNHNSSSCGNERLEMPIDGCFETSTNYDTSNAIDEHYRDAMNNHQVALLDLDMGTNSHSRLANLSEWPTNMHDLSNKLYVPVEVARDEELATIRRVTIDQLQIEKRSPLGEGHFGTVLQGTITCTMMEKSSMLNRSMQNNEHEFGTISMLNASTDVQSFDSLQQQPIQRRIPLPSSTSSGHGSSSTSSDFITAASCTDGMATANGDYLTPKSHTNSSTMSDYAVDENPASRPDSCSSYYNTSVNHSPTLNQNDVTIMREKDSAKAAGLLETTTLKVAIKRLKDNASAEEKRDFLQEAKLLANFDHPNIVHLIGICLDRGSTLIVMELMLGGDLIRYMQENRPRPNDPENNLTRDDLLSICLDIVSGCCYLEELNYIHRDLAARNCLVSSQKKEERVVKLADFGLARDIYKDSYYKKLNDSAMPLKWMAPECLIEQKFTTMSDVWSFGVVMWEVMSYCLKKPYEKVEPFFIKDHLTNGARLGKPENCSDDIYRLMNECWQLEPKKRPTFQECRAILIEIKNSTRH